MVIASFFSFYASFSAKIACIWLSVWAIRHKAEVDYPLDNPSRLVRWALVVAGFTAGYYLPGARLAHARVVCGFVALGFLCWPNFAYHLTNFFRKKVPQDSV